MKTAVRMRPISAPVHGVMLLEALVAILIFSLGILGMISLGAVSVATQSDAQYRTEAASLADEISGEIAVSVNRATGADVATSLAAFVHQADAGVARCSFTGTASSHAAVTRWVQKIAPTGGAPLLPGASASGLQIAVDTTTGVAGHNRVSVTVCWRAPRDTATRAHTVVTYVN